MSDMPMRLKYLKAKMKIILCIFLLCITAVSVFGEPQELNRIVGESVKFPAAVKIQGTLRYNGATIGDVIGGSFKRARSKFSDRLEWDSSTGLFSLSGLRLEDSGVYTVENNDGQKSVSNFSLTVKVPVSKPNVSITRNEYPCTIECTAENGTGATLSWYKEGEKEPYVSSRVASAPHLNLTEPVESGTYRCEAKNSVSNETSDALTVGANCTVIAPFVIAPFGPNPWMIVGIVACVIVIAVAVALIGYLYSKGCCRKNTVIFDGSTLQAFLPMRKKQEQGS